MRDLHLALDARDAAYIAAADAYTTATTPTAREGLEPVRLQIIV